MASVFQIKSTSATGRGLSSKLVRLSPLQLEQGFQHGLRGAAAASSAQDSCPYGYQMHIRSFQHPAIWSDLHG
jgi:hypothetical protein